MRQACGDERAPPRCPGLRPPRRRRACRAHCRAARARRRCDGAARTRRTGRGAAHHGEARRVAARPHVRRARCDQRRRRQQPAPDRLPAARAGADPRPAVQAGRRCEPAAAQGRDRRRHQHHRRCRAQCRAATRRRRLRRRLRVVADAGGEGAEPRDQALRARLGRPRLGRRGEADVLHGERRPLRPRLARVCPIPRPADRLPRRLERARLRPSLVRGAAGRARRRRLRLGRARRGGRRLGRRGRAARRPGVRGRRRHRRRPLPVLGRHRRRRRQLPFARACRRRREAAVGERERLPAARHRRRRDGAVDQPRLPRRRPDRLPRVAGPRGPLPEPPLCGRRPDPRERAVVGQLRRRLPAVDRRAVDAVRRAGLEVRRQRQRLARRRRAGGHVRDPEGARHGRLQHDRRGDDAPGSAAGPASRSAPGSPPAPSTSGRPTRARPIRRGGSSAATISSPSAAPSRCSSGPAGSTR